MRNTAMISPPFGGLKSVRFRGKDGLYATRIPRRGKPMDGGLPANYSGENIGFLLPLEPFCEGVARSLTISITK